MSTQPLSVAAQVEAAVMARNGEVRGGEVYFLCPIHADTQPSARWNSAKGTWFCSPCNKGGGTLDLAKRLGVPIGSSKPAAQVVATYDYQDETGTLLFQTVRMQPKAFKQRQPDGNGGWIWSLKGLRRMLYRLPELVASDPAGWVFVVEGEKDVDGLRLHGLTSTTSPMGAGKWRSEYAAFLAGRRVCVLPDNDQPGREHGRDVVESLRSLAAEVKLLELPGLPAKGDVSDWLAAGHTAGELLAVVDAAPSALDVPADPKLESRTLADVIAVFQQWLYMPDPGPLELALAAVVANMTSGDPVWLLLVGTPGSGKTEILNSLCHLPHLRFMGTFTEASLLSGTSKREVAEGTKGGLLNEIGPFGILVLKDFGSVLSMNRDARAAVLAAMREIFDGSWTRHVGADGGRELHWEGKLGLVGGCTPSVDEHHGVMSSLGERFVFCRMLEGDEKQRAAMALEHSESSTEMRSTLANAVAGLFAGVGEVSSLPKLSAQEKTVLVAVANLTTRCRSAIERHSYSREITLIPGAETPTRFVIVLSLLLRAMKLIGVAQDEAWRLIRKVGLDSMPQIRRRCLDTLLGASMPLTTSEVAEALGYPTQTGRRALEDLVCYGVVDRFIKGPGQADLWDVSEWTRETYATSVTVPETLEHGVCTDSSSLSNFSLPYKCQNVGEMAVTELVPTAPSDIYNDMSTDKCSVKLNISGVHTPHSNVSGTHGLSFDVTEDWQMLPEGAVTPAGCEYRLNMTSGRREVRLDPRAWVPVEDDSYTGYEGVE